MKKKKLFGTVLVGDSDMWDSVAVPDCDNECGMVLGSDSECGTVLVSRLAAVRFRTFRTMFEPEPEHNVWGSVQSNRRT